VTRFQTTRWSLVLSAGGDDADARAALAALCGRYRPPVLAYVRRQGVAAGDAEDLVQSFFERIIRTRMYDRADPARGRFRSFLLGSLANFLHDANRRDHRQKRGAGAMIGLDQSGIERVRAAPEDAPEAEFDRRWALAVLDGALARLAQECQQAGKGAWFRELEPFVLEPVERDGYQELALRLGMKPNTLAVAVGRLRQRLRQHVREELAETVQSDGDLDAELLDLRDALAVAAQSRS
jgi:RNA polymerase sigma-70 factor (ECF subfamily)